MKLIFFLLALIVIYFLTRSESFQEDGDFIEQKAEISPDQNENIITATQKYIKDTMNVCSYCIETNKIQVFKNSGNILKHKARYMFLVFSTYPYGIAVDVEVIDGKVTSLNTQPVDGVTTGSIIPYADDVAHDFLSYDQLAQKPSPVQ